MKLAIIPARGGSKRIPRKNIRDFCGKPVIAYSIEIALAAGCFDEIMVSTDDEDIAAIAKQYGAKVPFMRSAKTATDFATTADVIQEVLSVYQIQGCYPEFVCCIYPTAPFVTITHLQDGLNELIQHASLRAVFPVVRFSYPIQRALRLNNRMVSLFCPEYLNTRSQDLESAYHDAGQFYWLRTQDFLQTGDIIGDNVKAMILPEWQVQDIDNEDDWLIAEMKYRLFSQLKTNAAELLC